MTFQRAFIFYTNILNVRSYSLNFKLVERLSFEHLYSFMSKVLKQNCQA